MFKKKETNRSRLEEEKNEQERKQQEERKKQEEERRRELEDQINEIDRRINLKEMELESAEREQADAQNRENYYLRHGESHSSHYEKNGVYLTHTMFKTGELAREINNLISDRCTLERAFNFYSP